MNTKLEPIELTAIVDEQYAGVRVDAALAKIFPQYSRATLQSWLKNQQIIINGKNLKPKEKLIGGEQIVINAQLESKQNWQAQPISLDIVYQDEALIVVNKPTGLVVHPAAGNPDSTLVNALLHYAPELEVLPRAGIIHRIDKETTGLLVIARNLIAHHSLVQQLQERTMKRQYQALVQGTFIAGGTIDEPMGRHPKQRMKRAVIDSGKDAITHYRVLEKFPFHTLLQVNLETGRTHQIRVHMAHIKHPIVGDPLYGGREKIPANCSEQLAHGLRHFKRQALHAESLTLTHPITGETCQWHAPLPADMSELLNLLRAEYAHKQK